MQINSINTNLAAYSAQTNIRNASSNAAKSVARLSSGNRITQAADDVAGLAIGTSLSTNVRTLRTALTNASQAVSLLQVADAALSQITEILQRQKAIAVQAGSGTLGTTERTFLNAEFTALTSEIDRIAENTNFNNVKLINGGLSSAALFNSSTAAASKGSLSLSFNNTISVGENIIIGGITLKGGTASSGTTFEVGSSIGETLDNLAEQLNTLASTSSYSTTLGQATYSRSGNTLVITAKAGGSLSNNFSIGDSPATTTTIAARTGTTGTGDPTADIATEGAYVGLGTSTVTVNKTAHGFETGDVVLIGSGANATTDIFQSYANGLSNNEVLGKFVVTKLSDNQFTYSALDIGRAVTLGNNPFAVTDGSADVVMTVGSGNATGFAVNDWINITGATNITEAGPNGGEMLATEINGWRQITAVGATTVTFAANSAATLKGTGGTTSGGGAAADLYAGNNFGGNLTFTKASATNNGQSVVDGGFQGSSFNLWTNSISTFTSATQQAVAAGNSAAIPFEAGDALTATINGITKTLYTAVDGASITDVVNGINANAQSTGVHATLVNTAGTYNIRFNYDGLANNVELNVGSNYDSTTLTLAGGEVGATGIAVGTDGITASASNGFRSLYYTSYIDVFSATTPITAAATATVTAATPSAASAPFRNGDALTISINGEQKTLHTFAASQSLVDIAASINAQSASTGVRAVITSDATNTASGLRLLVNSSNPSKDVVTVSAGAGVFTTGITVNKSATLATTGAALTQVTSAGLKGGVDDGLGKGSVTVSGTAGDSIVAGSGSAISQAKASSAITLTANAVAGDNVQIGGVTFIFTSNTTRAANEILLGSTIQESIDNAVNTINSYTQDGYAIGNESYILNQLNVSRDGSSLKFEAKGLGTVTDLSGTAATVARSITGSAISSGTLNNSSATYGVDVTGITNKDFQGKISGFSATYKNVADTVDLSVKIGDFTYSASNVDTTVSTNTAIRFYSDTVGGQDGGYFDVQLAAGSVLSFAGQTGADAVAARLDSAFSNLTFTQKRTVSTYTASGSIVSGNAITGSLAGTSFSAKLSNFDALKLTDISVTAPSGSNTDAKLSLVINGVNYSTTSGLTSKLGANQTYKLLSETDPNQFIEFTTGDTAIQLDTADKASALEAALNTAFGTADGAASISFQVGTSTTDTLSVSINDSKTSTLFEGATLDVLTQESAATAVAAIDVALQNVTSVRANVGALQSRFNFASANIESSIQNQDAARGTLLDTDIADESTAYAISQVKLQAGISVLAQANQQLQSLLKLIG